MFCITNLSPKRQTWSLNSLKKDSKRTNLYRDKNVKNLAYDAPQSWDCSIIPTQWITTPTEMQHFSAFSMAFRHPYSTIEFAWGIRRDVHFGLSPSDYSLFYCQTVITNSVRQSMWEKEARNHTSCVSQVSTSTVALYKNIQSTLVFELRSGLVHAKPR